MWHRWVSAGLIGLGLVGSGMASASIELVSRIEGAPPLATGPNLGFGSLSLSDNARITAFSSNATNLNTADTNGAVGDIFVFDADTDSTEILTPGGNGTSFSPVISGDGRFVAFVSVASNLAGGDTNGIGDVFLHDREANSTVLLTPGSDGESGNPSISIDGRFVAFESQASNLVANDANGAVADIFVYDRENGTIVKLAAGSTPSISDDGRFVAYNSLNPNALVVFDLDTGAIEQITETSPSAGDGAIGGTVVNSAPSISQDGRFVGYVSQLDNSFDPQTPDGPLEVFLFDRDTQSPNSWHRARMMVKVRSGSATAVSLCSLGLQAVTSQMAIPLTLRTSSFIPERPRP